jgi:hypothetical protein
MSNNQTINTIPKILIWARLTNNPIINSIIFIITIIGKGIKLIFKGLWEFLVFLSPAFELLIQLLIIL